MKIPLWTAFHGTTGPNFSIDLGNEQLFNLLYIEKSKTTRRLHFKKWVTENLKQHKMPNELEKWMASTK